MIFAVLAKQKGSVMVLWFIGLVLMLVGRKHPGLSDFALDKTKSEEVLHLNLMIELDFERVKAVEMGRVVFVGVIISFDIIFPISIQ